MVITKLRGWRFGVFEADLETHELRRHGVHIKLAGQPFQALSVLLNRPGDVVSREELRNALWPGEPWGDHDQRLNKAINKIREALNDSADRPRLIETIPRVGYRFLGSVTPLRDPFAESRVETKIEPEPEPPQVEITPARIEIRAWPRRWAAGALILAAVSAGVLYRAVTLGQAAVPKGQWLSASQAAPLTTYVGSEQYPAFSPDGKKLAFAWDGPELGGRHIYLISSTGRDLKQLTEGSFSDYAPVWSSDGATLAFMRESATHVKELWTVGANGSNARKLVDFGLISRFEQPLTWTHDPRWIIAAAKPAGEGPSALYLISALTGERRRITSPPMQSAGDLSPAISRDGKRIAFTRGANVARREVFIVTLSDDLSPIAEPVRVTNLQRIIETLAWSADGSKLYFSASPTPSGARHIFRIGIVSGKMDDELVETGIEGVHPVISPDGQALCYVRNNIEQTSIWRLELPDGLPGSKAAGPKRSMLLSSTRRDYTADLSPDGKQMVFSSVRSGASEIWVSDIHGSNLRQITFKGASTPRWSPDGRWLVYESSAAGQPDIYVFDLRSNAERRLTTDPDTDLRPSWSRDSRFVYFSSARTGRSQLWKVPVEGGVEKQITRGGGAYAVEAPDRTLYYTSADQPASIRSVPVEGGVERTLVENVVGHSAISLGRRGLYYLASMSFTGAQMGFYSFADQAARPLVTLDRPVHHFLSSPPDGASVLFTQVDREDSDLMLLSIGKAAASGELAAR
ncbi:MAG: yycF [Bryobacterales bacterium]|nr:yycF [Bryobacterales bacterium]